MNGADRGFVRVSLIMDAVVLFIEGVALALVLVRADAVSAAVLGIFLGGTLLWAARDWERWRHLPSPFVERILPWVGRG